MARTDPDSHVHHKLWVHRHQTGPLLDHAGGEVRCDLAWASVTHYVRYEEFRGQVRDPYPAIGEKAVGRWGRIASVVSITLTLYGGGCVFIVLISQLTGSLMAGAGLHLDLCTWMVIVAAALTPLTWMGTPKDFWPIAVGALITTIIACILIIINCVLAGEELEARVYPAPTANGFFKGSYFQSI